MNSNNFTIVKKSDGSIINFYLKGTDIYCEYFTNNSWNNACSIINSCNKYFSVILMPDDKIYIFNKDFNNNIVISQYSNNLCSSIKVIKNSQNTNIDFYFEAVRVKNTIHIFYSISTLQNKKTTIFHQYLNNLFELSSPVNIDTQDFQYDIPFKLNILSNGSIVLIYQKFTTTHMLGFKLFTNNTWSEFSLINKNNSPYPDYSIFYANYTFHTIYIIDKGTSRELVHSTFTSSVISSFNVCSDAALKYCSIYKYKNTFFINWIADNICYVSSDDNGMNFSLNPKIEYVDTSAIVRGKYFSNYIRERDSFIADEIYMIKDKNLKTIIFFDITSLNCTLADTACSIKKSFIDKDEATCLKENKDNKDNKNNKNTEIPENYIETKLSNYESQIDNKNQLIMQLRYLLKDEHDKNALIESKLKSYINTLIEYERSKKELNNNITKLQTTLISKENRINELEKQYFELKNSVKSVHEENYQKVGTSASFFDRIFKSNR